MEHNLTFPQKIKHRISLWSGNATAKFIHPKEPKVALGEVCTPRSAEEEATPVPRGG